jgi:hypothetical protein
MQNPKFELNLKRIAVIALSVAWLICLSYFSPYYGTCLIVLGFILTQILVPVSVGLIVDFLKQGGWKKEDNRFLILKLLKFSGIAINWLVGISVASSILYFTTLKLMTTYFESIFKFVYDYIPFGEHISKNWFEYLVIYSHMFIFIFFSTLLLLIILRDRFRRLDILKSQISTYTS